MSNPSLYEVELVAQRAVAAFASAGIETCLFGGAACAAYGNTRTPGDVDIVCLTDEYTQEQLKTILVSKNPNFYTVRARDPDATYRVLWYRTGYRRSCKVDVLLPGILNIPDVPSSRIVHSAKELPLMPFFPLLLLKLQGWQDHGESDKDYMRAKQPTDVRDVVQMLGLAATKYTKQTVASEESWLPEEFMAAAKRRVKLFVESHPETASYWRLLGPLLQELHIDDDDAEFSPRAGPAHAQPSPAFRPPPGFNMRPAATTTDITPYKNWTCIYPIYLDAKRAYGTGLRRVPRDKAVWWPLSKDIADAATSLGLPVLHEVNKAHPRDWENPGRVRVQWKKDGRLVNPILKTKKLLLQMISERIQIEKPQFKPVPPFTSSAETPAPAPAPAASKAGKAKQTSAPAPKPKAQQARKPALPSPPQPHPPLAARVSAYSPALASGVLVDTVKAGMAAQAQEAAAGQPGAPAGQQGAPGMQKGKRKVVRVRG
ncbi:hypothetical protein MKEN_00593800 [Mycena kentingensis (nom. inval.)]|nr:hypothetical protein MKEN_00593800 [Mycena kentingensis (nom. inval.)]